MARLRDRDDDRDRKRGGSSSYEKNLAANVKKRAEQSGGMFDSIFKEGVQNYQPQSGDNTVRFLPPTFEDADHYGLETWVHYGIGADRGSYLCPKKMKDKPCPICEAAQEMKSEGEVEAAKKISAKQRVLVYLIDRNERRPKLQVWAMPWTIDKDVANVSINKKTGEALNIINEKKGYDVSFRKDGQKRNTKYSGIQIDRDPSPLSDDKREAQDWTAETEDAPLDTLLKYFPADYLQKVVDGHVASSDDDDDDDDRRGSKKKKRGRDDDDDAPRGKKRRGRDDDDDDDDDRPKKRRGRDDDDDDDDEDDRRSSKKRRGRDDDDDDDDDDDAPKKSKRKRASDDDDDDDDDAPKKKKRSRASDDDDDDADDAPKGRKKRKRDDEDEVDPADDDDDEADRPRRKKSKGDDDDDDDEDERPKRRSRSDDDDDDEDERPRKRRR